MIYKWKPRSATFGGSAVPLACSSIHKSVHSCPMQRLFGKGLEEFLDRGHCTERVLWQNKILVVSKEVRRLIIVLGPKYSSMELKSNLACKWTQEELKGRENHVARSRVPRTSKQMTRLDQRRIRDNLLTGSIRLSS